MTATLIKLDDGTLVEVEVPGDYIEPVVGSAARRVKTTIEDTLKPILINTSKPLRAVWEELNKEMTVEKAEIELNFGFEVEGNLYLAKSKANANLTVKLILVSPT